MRQEPFELPVDGGAIRGHRGGNGRPALLLHGGAAIPDYLEECAEHERQTLSSRLPAARVPALFVHGEQDPLPTSSSTGTAALIPGACVETIPDCGHFPWLEQPAAFRAAVERLLA